MVKWCALFAASGLLFLAAFAGVGAAAAQPNPGISAREISRVRKRLRKDFGFSLPASVKFMTVARSANNWVMFAGVKMPVPDAVGFKKELIALRRPKTQILLYEDKDSGARLGYLPAFDVEPVSIEAWQTNNNFTGGETMLYISNNRQIGESEFKVVSYLVMFSQESTGLAYFYFYPARSGP